MPTTVYLLSTIASLLLLGLSWALGNATDTPVNDAPQCKTLFTSGYGYRQFFHIPPSMNVLDGNLFTIKFQVKARSNAHILLSPTPSPEVADPVYEIVLGAGKIAAPFSEIRRRRKADTKSSVTTIDILSGTELKGFWIKMDQDGIIQVGTNGEDLPFMEWVDPEPLDIQYFSFCTWSGVAGKWLYDCALTDNDIGSIAFQPPQTSEDKLREALLTNYDPYSRPVKNASDLTKINIQIQANHVDIDTKTSVMTVASSFVVEWYDEKMIWNPENFDNLSRLNLVHQAIWKPQLIHLNAVGKEVSPFSQTGMQVSSEGKVKWRPHCYFQSRCRLDLRSWPWDTQICSIYIGFLNQPDSLQMLLVENESLLDMQKTSSEWEVIGLGAQSTNFKVPWLLDPTAFLSIGTDDTVSSSALEFTFTLKRLNHGYYYTLVIPLLVKVYSWVLAVVGCATVLSVLISSLVSLPQRQHPPHLLIKIVSSKFVGSVFCLPNSQSAVDYYGQMRETEREDSLTSWGLLAVVCDRAAFVFALVAYTAILVS